MKATYSLLLRRFFVPIRCPSGGYTDLWVSGIDANLSFQLAEADLATQARLTAAAVAQNVQKGTKGAAEQFNKFVEGSGEGGSSQRAAVAPEKKDFWDSFGAPAANRSQSPLAGGSTTKKSSAIGTAAMKKGGGKEEWGDDGWDKF